MKLEYICVYTFSHIMHIKINIENKIVIKIVNSKDRWKWSRGNWGRSEISQLVLIYDVNLTHY